MNEFIAGVLTLIMMVGFGFACFGFTWGGWIGIAAMFIGMFLFSGKENN